jgi:hypothetical protein|mmetsp:Transcript_10194/g.16549  ORF Transcript_10194/g.16549 Transcript_10194/m.16549 type:complete len:318 (+) Transcript_10194:101-1054(+)
MFQPTSGIMNQSLSQPYGDYGASKGVVRRQRQRMNLVPVCQCLFVPWLTFCVVYAITTFRIHYDWPWACWLLVGVFSLVTLMIGTHAASNTIAKIKNEHAKEPSWTVFLFISMVIAISLGSILGTMNFHSFMQRYYDYENLNQYMSVDVTKMRGAELMDGGRLNFINGTNLDTRKALGFKNADTYCVAPISMTSAKGVPAELFTYDFWAVGVNCCSGDVSDFKCGEYNNPKARAGLRVLEDETRAFYRLAVQQAEAMFHIRADHPLFLYWGEDASEEMQSWKDEGYKFFCLALLVHFFWQLFVVILGVLGFRKLSHF